MSEVKIHSIGIICMYKHFSLLAIDMYMYLGRCSSLDTRVIVVQKRYLSIKFTSECDIFILRFRHYLCLMKFEIYDVPRQSLKWILTALANINW